jgi:ribosome maturation factor RimP
MTSTSSTLQGIDRDALQRVVEPVVRAHGAEVVDMELKPDRGSWVLRIYVEKQGAAANNMSTKDAAVNLELCADVSRDLSPALDVVDLIPHAYHLEVSSPGVERPLREEKDFVRFAGQKAKLKMREPVGGQRVLVGTLEGVHGGVVRVKEGSRVHEARLDSIESARLVFEFGTDGRQHKRKHRG